MQNYEVNISEVNVINERIKKMLTDNPEVKKAIQDLISDEMWKARCRLADDLKNSMPGSTQEAWRSVRRVVYDKVFGGNLNIRNMRRKGEAKWKVIQKIRKVDQNPHMRGGNRRRRTLRTAQVEGYEGKARGFILRFVENGTKQRFIGGRNTWNKDQQKYLDKLQNGTGNRGRITPRFMFDRFAQNELNAAAYVISEMIDVEIEKVISKYNT